MSMRYGKIIIFLAVVFMLSACHVSTDSSSDPSKEPEAGGILEPPAQTTTYPLDHDKFRLVFDIAELPKLYPETYADISIFGNYEVKEITPGKVLLEVRNHQPGKHNVSEGKFNAIVSLVLIDLEKPEGYKAVIVSENDDIYIGLRCTQDKIIVKQLDRVDIYNHQLEPIKDGSVSMPEIFQTYYDEKGWFNYDISNDLQEVIFNRTGKIHLYNLTKKRDKIIYRNKSGLLPLFTEHDQMIIQGFGGERICKKILSNRDGNILCERESYYSYPWDWTMPQKKFYYPTYLPEDALHPKPYIAICDLTGDKHTDTIHEIHSDELPLDIGFYGHGLVSEHGLMFNNHASELKFRDEDGVWYREETMGYYYIDFATMKAKELIKYSVWNVDVDPNRDKTQIRELGLTSDGQMIVRLEDGTESGYTKIYVSEFYSKDE